MTAVVHVVDDDAAVRIAMGRQLRLAGYEVFAYENAAELLERLPTVANQGCIILDVRIPGISGPELQQRLISLGVNLPIIFLTGYTDVPLTVRAIKAGAEDFLIKPISGRVLLETIERAIANARTSRDRRDEISTLRMRLDSLTPRENQVFEQVVHGRLNKQIAHALDITERTVKAHRQSVMEKLKARSLLELVLVAERLDILSGSDRDLMLERSLRAPHEEAGTVR